MDIKKLDKKFNGFEHGNFRGRFLLLKNKVLNENEFLLWELGFSVLADWDIKHEDTFGSFKLTTKEIAYYLGWDKSTVSRNSQTLFKKNFWEKDSENRIWIKGFDITRHYGELSKVMKPIDLQQYIAGQQPSTLNQQQSVAITPQEDSKEDNPFLAQDDAVPQQEDSQSLGSFKDDVSSSSMLMLRTMEEYERIYEEAGENALSIDDMIWIDNYFYQTEGIRPN